MTLLEGLNRMLDIAQDRLKTAKVKDKRWDIAHYRKDIRIIKIQILQETREKKFGRVKRFA